MPRAPRVLVDGALYHVHSRTVPGRRVFEDEDEADQLLTLLRELKLRDGCTIFAWCVMPTHYHLAIRTASVRLSRTMHALQGRFSQSCNRRLGTCGPLWQGRYKAHLITEERYARWLVYYIHLNPVRAGLVDDPSAYSLCGHSELVGQQKNALTDVDESLSFFGSSPATARRSYLEKLRWAAEQGWNREASRALPWWQGGGDREPHQKEAAPQVDILGRSTARERVQVSAEAFIVIASRVLTIDLEALAGRKRDQVVAGARELIATVGMERLDLRATDIAHLLCKHPDWISALASRGALRRSREPAYAEACNRLEAAVAAAVDGGEVDQPAVIDKEWAAWS